MTGACIQMGSRNKNVFGARQLPQNLNKTLKEKNGAFLEMENEKYRFFVLFGNLNRRRR